MTNRPIAALFVVGLTLASAAWAEESKDKKPRDARETVAAFLDAAVNGRLKEAAAMGDPDSAYSRPEKIKEFAELKIKKLALKSVHADDTGALAITADVDVKDAREPKGPLVLTLVKKEDRWLVRDTDLETEESAKGELRRFLDKHPDAKPVPAKKKDAKEGEKKSK